MIDYLIGMLSGVFVGTLATRSYYRTSRKIDEIIKDVER